MQIAALLLLLFFRFNGSRAATIYMQFCSQTDVCRKRYSD